MITDTVLYDSSLFTDIPLEIKLRLFLCSCLSLPTSPMHPLTITSGYTYSAYSKHIDHSCAVIIMLLYLANLQIVSWSRGKDFFHCCKKKFKKMFCVNQNNSKIRVHLLRLCLYICLVPCAGTIMACQLSQTCPGFSIESEWEHPYTWIHTKNQAAFCKIC